MSKRAAPEINTGSMADIAFLLLVFFLVTTTMEQDTGIQRRLPEKQPENIKPPEVKRRNVFVLLLNRADELLVNGEPGDINLLRERVKEFILNPRNDDDLSEKQPTAIEGLGSYDISKGVVALQTDRLTSFNKYMEVQDVLTRAFNELRNDLASARFGKTFDELQILAKANPDYDKKSEAIKKAIPISISEASPKKTK
ncbi:MAG: biopolymer transporter ExbD [Flavobacteriales bacterium]|nr:biopolymer transporter ExbD [Flavobacteriales bacterium]MCZ2443564.1 biopolymer transporter ExbD [Flavobacteriales bacterium]